MMTIIIVIIFIMKREPEPATWLCLTFTTHQLNEKTGGIGWDRKEEPSLPSRKVGKHRNNQKVKQKKVKGSDLCYRSGTRVGRWVEVDLLLLLVCTELNTQYSGCFLHSV